MLTTNLNAVALHYHYILGNMHVKKISIKNLWLTIMLRRQVALNNELV